MFSLYERPQAKFRVEASLTEDYQRLCYLFSIDNIPATVDQRGGKFSQS